MVSKINSENKLDEQLKLILENIDSKEWHEVIREVCNMMAEHLKSASYDANQHKGKYDPSKMFSCLAESMVLMMGVLVCAVAVVFIGY